MVKKSSRVKRLRRRGPTKREVLLAGESLFTPACALKLPQKVETGSYPHDKHRSWFEQLEDPSHLPAISLAPKLVLVAGVRTPEPAEPAPPHRSPRHRATPPAASPPPPGREKNRGRKSKGKRARLMLNWHPFFLNGGKHIQELQYGHGSKSRDPQPFGCVSSPLRDNGCHSADLENVEPGSISPCLIDIEVSPILDSTGSGSRVAG